jgi:septal ring factor EnvC (AmiA/AmiB activator)
VFVQIANLQMAKARQQRIRASLQTQVDRCTAEIDRLDAEIRRRFDQVGLQQKDDDTPSTDGGFQYDY